MNETAVMFSRGWGVRAIPRRAAAALGVICCVYLPASPVIAQDTLITTEHQITNSPAFETTPTLAANGPMDWLSDASRALAQARFASTEIDAQLLDPNGIPIGAPVLERGASRVLSWDPFVSSRTHPKRRTPSLRSDLRSNACTSKTHLARVRPTYPETPSHVWHTGSREAGYGVGDCPEPVLVTRAGAGAPISRTLTDLAGNSATTNTTVNVDRSKPRILATADPAPNANDWNFLRIARGANRGPA